MDVHKMGIIQPVYEGGIKYSFAGAQKPTKKYTRFGQTNFGDHPMADIVQ